MRWKCPKCGGTELEVKVEVLAKLIQYVGDDGEGTFETDIRSGDHEWDSNSAMVCLADGCEHVAPAGEFDTEDK